MRIIREPQPADPLTDQESRYLNIFRQTTASTLAEYLETTLWNRIVLQATEQALYVKHSVIALGALHKALDGDPYPHESHDKLHQSVHYHFALQQYGKALRLTRAACSGAKVDTRTLLISCFLSVCFECIHWSTATAVAHIQSGIMMLDEYCSKRPQCVSTDERQALPGFLQDETLSVLSRLESDVAGLYDAGQLTPPPDVKSAVVGIFYYMPTETLESLTSARKYLDLLLREIGWFVTSCNEQRWTYMSQGEATTTPNACFTPTPSQQTRLLTFQTLLRKWLRTFQSIKTTSEQSRNPDCLLAVTALRLRVTCASISLSCCFGPETAYDAYIPDFEEALHLAERLHAGGPSWKSLRPTFITNSILIRRLYSSR